MGKPLIFLGATDFTTAKAEEQDAQDQIQNRIATTFKHTHRR